MLILLGLDSARKTEKSEAQAIWSMAYEDFNADVLNKHHQQMLTQYWTR